MKPRVQVEKYLRQMCENTRYDVRPETPRHFSELVTSMRSLSLDELKELHELLKTNSICQGNPKTL